jgi:hypothetical protein
MPHPTDTDYDHSARKRDANKREDEAVAYSREALDKRLKKRAAEITAEDSGPVLDPADKQTSATRDWLKSSAEIEAAIERGEFSDLPPLGDSRRQIKSPAFPTVAEALERRQRDREHFAVRLMLAFAFVSLSYSLIFGGTFGYVAGGVFFVGAIIAAAVTRSYRNG